MGMIIMPLAFAPLILKWWNLGWNCSVWRSWRLWPRENHGESRFFFLLAKEGKRMDYAQNGWGFLRQEIRNTNWLICVLFGFLISVQFAPTLLLKEFSAAISACFQISQKDIIALCTKIACHHDIWNPVSLSLLPTKKAFSAVRRKYFLSSRRW